MLKRYRHLRAKEQHYLACAQAAFDENRFATCERFTESAKENGKEANVFLFMVTLTATAIGIFAGAFIGSF